MAKRERKRVVLVKKETTYGVDAIPTGAANAMLAKNFSFTPMQGQDVIRKFDLPYYIAPQKLPSGLYCELSFELELVGAAALGTAAAWSAVIGALGFSQTLSAGVSTIYSLVTDNPDSCSVYFNQDGVQHKILGARGTGSFGYTVDGLPMLKVRLLGKYSTPTDTAMPAPTLTAFQQPEVVNFFNTLVATVNSVNVKMRSFEVEIGNKVTFRSLANSEEVIITDREVTASMVVEQEAMAVMNPYALSQNQAAFGVNFTHGTVASKKSNIVMPNCRLNRMSQPSAEDGVMMWSLGFTPLPIVGNDELTLTLT